MDETVYFYGIGHPPAGDVGDTRDFGRADLQRVADRLPCTPVDDYHDGNFAGEVLKAWIGDDNALHSIGAVQGKGLAQNLLKGSLISGVYDGLSLSHDVRFTPEGGKDGNGVVRPIGNPVGMALLPIEGAGRGSYCRVKAVLRESELGETEERRGGINISQSIARSGKNAALAEVIRSLQRAKNKSNICEKNAMDPKSDVQPMEIVPTTPQPVATPVTPTPTPGTTAAPTTHAMTAEETTALMGKLTEKLEEMERDKQRLLKELAARPTPRAESEADKVKSLISTSYQALESHLRNALKAMGKNAEKSEVQDILEKMTEWSGTNDPAKKNTIVNELAKSMGTLVYAQACSATELMYTERLQTAEREKEIQLKKNAELQSSLERLTHATITKAQDVLQKCDQACKELESSSRIEDRIQVNTRPPDDRKRSHEAAFGVTASENEPAKLSMSTIREVLNKEPAPVFSFAENILDRLKPFL